jgi:hypothetical protein
MATRERALMWDHNWNNLDPFSYRADCSSLGHPGKTPLLRSTPTFPRRRRPSIRQLRLHHQVASRMINRQR